MSRVVGSGAMGHVTSPEPASAGSRATGHVVLHGCNLVNSLYRLILLGIEKREQSPLRSKKKNPGGEKSRGDLERHKYITG
jgi:hypothetical protein